MKLLSDSQNKILNALKQQPKMSIDQMVGRLKITKTAVRHHLLSLERRGLVERSLQRARRGRPSIVFYLTPAANRLFPSKEAEILSDLIRFLTDSGNNSLIESFFEQYWEKRYQAIVQRLKATGKDDLRTRVIVLKEVLEKEGFMPRSKIVRRGEELILQECHCPIEAAVQVTHLPCRLERRLISRFLNGPVTSAKIRSQDNGGPCEYKLPVSKLTDI